MGKKVKVINESDTGRNQKFQDDKGKTMTRNQFVREIERGNYSDYHVREVNGVKTPCSNPDGKTNNNLG
ncbi:DUF3892 domain-containing protein [uncultured Ilyobacter sp.]|uniref:DUF3892 domain-containing protein n=1 Tax=uncultured Ilyobacter sp. TaxID=544433 RepID=UPI0029C0B4DF|nr:DUF3892 domain-containing protein [uncultured Ilyobacter sp.]